MSITDRTRKTLWGKSGNRCAICKVELVGYRKNHTKDLIIGEECHIISSREFGPRFRFGLDLNFDDYDNLILLCRNHHKMVDEQINEYTAESLLLIKIMHEIWVKETLDKVISGQDDGKNKITRINSGKELFDIINSVHAYSFEHDELYNNVEENCVAAFFEELEDYGDLMGMRGFSKAEQVTLGLKFTELLKSVENLGFFVFGERRRRGMRDDEGNSLGIWNIALVHVVHKSNRNFIKGTK